MVAAIYAGKKGVSLEMTERPIKSRRPARTARTLWWVWVYGVTAQRSTGHSARLCRFRCCHGTLWGGTIGPVAAWKAVPVQWDSWEACWARMDDGLLSCPGFWAANSHSAGRQRATLPPGRTRTREEDGEEIRKIRFHQEPANSSWPMRDGARDRIRQVAVQLVYVKPS